MWDKMKEWLCSCQGVLTSDHTWQAYNTNPDRITAVAGADAAAQLPIRNRELATFLSIVVKACNIQHYNVIVRHSTSLTWIYNKLREDYDIQQKGIQFFTLFDLQYQRASRCSMTGTV